MKASGLAGEALAAKLGARKASHSLRQPSISASHRRRPVRRRRPSAGDLRQELPQEGPGVGDEAEHYGVDAADLVGVDVDLDDLGRRDVPRAPGLPGRSRTVVEARANGQHHVAAAARLVGLVGTVAAIQADRQRVAGIDRPHAVGQVADRSLESVRQFGELRPGFGYGDAVADVDERSLRTTEEIGGGLHVLLTDAGTDGERFTVGRRVVDIVFLDEQVVRHVDVDRPRTPRSGECPWPGASSPAASRPVWPGTSA